MVLVAITLVPFVVAAVGAFTRTWVPSSDEAVFLAGIIDRPDAVPTVGVYSRYGWNHPGPLLAYWFLLPTVATNGLPAAALVTGLALKALSAVAVVVLARRTAGVAAGVLAVVMVMLLVWAHPGTVYALWNPTIVLLPFTAFLVAVWAAVTGDDWALPVVVLCGSLAVQAHLGYAPVVAVVGGAAAVLVARRWWVQRGGTEEAPPRGPLTAAILALVVWVPPLVDQGWRTGNLGAVAEHVVDHDLPTLGASSALSLSARSYLPWGPWSGGPEPLWFLGSLVGRSAWWLVVPTAGLVVAGLSARCRRDGTLAALVAVAGVAAVAGVVALAATTDLPYPYLFVWIRGIAALIWFAVALAAVRELAARGVALSPVVVRAGAVVLVVVGLAVGLTQAGGPRPVDWQSTAVADLLPEALDAVPPGSSVSVESNEPSPGVAAGLVLELLREGRTVTVGPAQGAIWGDSRVGDPADADVRLAVTTDPGSGTLSPADEWVVLDRHDRRSSSEPPVWLQRAR
jgi:hypothetical protein